MPTTFTIQFQAIAELESWFARAEASVEKFRRTLVATETAAGKLEQAQTRAAQATAGLAASSRTAGGLASFKSAVASRFDANAAIQGVGFLGDHVGGQAGQALRSAATGAGLGAVLGPEGALAGGAIGAALGLAGGSGESPWKKVDASALKRFTDEAKRLGKAENGDGLRRLAGDLKHVKLLTDDGAHGLSRLRAEIAKVATSVDARNVSRFGAALKQIASGPRFQTAATFTAALSGPLSKLPEQRRNAGAAQMVQLAQGLERDGHLPEGATDRIIKRLERRWDGLAIYLRSVGRSSSRELARTLGDERVANAVGDQVSEIGRTWADAPKLAKTSAANARKNWVQEMEFLTEKMRSEDPKQRAAAKRFADNLRALGVGAAAASRRAAERTQQAVTDGWARLAQSLNNNAFGVQLIPVPAAKPSSAPRHGKAVAPPSTLLGSPSLIGTGRAGGVARRFAAGGLVPALVSPGEQIVEPDGGAWIVPGAREPRDSVLAMLKPQSAILTAHGQRLAAAGMSLGDVIANQMPHFGSGGALGKLLQPYGASDAFHRGFDAGMAGAHGLFHTHAGDTSLFKAAISGVRAPRQAGAPAAGLGSGGLGAWHPGMNTLTWGNAFASRFGLHITSGYRTPQHNAAVGGVRGSLHTHGSSSNPGAIDFVPPSAAALAFAKGHGAREALIHNVGSGLHLHVGFFRGGGVVGGLISRVRDAGSGASSGVIDAMRRIGGLIENAKGIAYDRLERLESGVRDGIRELAQGGLTGRERVQVSRLRGVLTLLDAEMGKRLGAQVSRAQQALDTVSARQTREARSRAIKGIDDDSIAGLGSAVRSDATTLGTLIPQLGDKHKRTGLYAALDRARKQHDPAAVKSITEQIDSVTTAIGDTRVDLAGKRRELAHARRYDPLNAQLALDQLSGDQGKQLNDLTQLKGLLTSDLGDAVKRKDYAAIQDLTSQLESVNGSIQDNTQAVNDQAAQAQARMELDRQLVENQQRMLAVAASQPNVLLGAMVDAMNGRIGGMVGLGSQTPGFAGSKARY